MVGMWYCSPASRYWIGPDVPGGAAAFHRSLPGYAPTPLVSVPEIAAELGVGRVLVKDESARFGLPAFKVLGASWAARQILARRPGVMFVTATDGNHGRAVARMAAHFGVQATVFVPAVMRRDTAARIAGEGAKDHRRPGPAHPAVLSVEPDTAACVLASLTAGRPVTVPTGATVMAGLNCGTVSGSAWPVLHAGCDAAVAVTDDEALRAVRDLDRLGISSGPSGAATLAGLRAALSSPQRRACLGLAADAVVVLLSTEGGHLDTAGLAGNRDGLVPRVDGDRLSARDICA